jgi:DNA-binding winged helix-turn-helix (wHTH) protein/tetratricopeptide (TPR) repeat protein
MNAPDPEDGFYFGPFMLATNGRGLSRVTEAGDRIPVSLGSRALTVLELLVRRAGDLVSKRDIMAEVWPGTIVEEANLTVQISSLRRALGPSSQQGGWIVTVPGRGYRFIGQVTTRGARSVEGALTPVPDAPRAGPSLLHRQIVGRDRMLRDLEQTFATIMARERQILFIPGEAGLGKTTFVTLAMERFAAAGGRVLRGRCSEFFGTGEAFLPLIEALQELCRTDAGGAFLAGLRDRAPAWLVQMPEFLTPRDRDILHRESLGATRERMLREFCDLMEGLSADHPWLIVLEDLHWSDPATLDVLSRLASRDRPARLLVMATYRPIDSRIDRHPVLNLHHDLRLHGLCQDIQLDRLSLDDIETYIAARFESSELAHRVAAQVFRRSDGLPLFVVSLLDHLVAIDVIRRVDGQWRSLEDAALSRTGMPRDLRDMIGRSLERLPADVQELLEAASATGTDLAAALVASATDNDALEVERKFEILARQGQILLSAGMAEWPDGTVSARYEFQHALYQEVLYQRLSPGLRVQIHRRLGARLERAYGARAEDIAPVLAMHLEQGRQFAEAIHYLKLAAASAAARFGNKEAVNYLTRALDLVARLPEADQVAHRIELARRRGWVSRAAGDLRTARADIETVITSAAAADLPMIEASGLLDLSWFSLQLDRPRALEAADQALAKSAAIGDVTLTALAGGTRAAIALYLKGWRIADAEACQRALDVTVNATDPVTVLRRHVIQSFQSFFSGDHATCRNAARFCKEQSGDGGDTFLYAVWNTLETLSLIYLGDWRTARHNSLVAVDLAERNVNPAARIIARLTMAWLHAEAGDFEGAKTWCDEDMDPGLAASPFIFFLHCTVLAKILSGLRQDAAALARFQSAIDHVDNAGVDIELSMKFDFTHSWGDHWLRMGDLGRARTAADELRAMSEQAPNRYFLALAHRLLAKIAIDEGHDKEAQDQIARAMTCIESAARPHAAWRVWLTAAAIHERAGDRDAAERFRAKSADNLRILTEAMDPEDPLRLSLWHSFEATPAAID